MVTRSGESGYSIKELPSEKFYEWLENYFISVSSYYNDCNKLSDLYKDNEKIKRLCAKVVKYIKNKPSIPNRIPLKDHHCNLFNYWIYEQLVSHYKDKPQEPVHVFGDFIRVLTGFAYYLNENTCKLDYKIAMIPDNKNRKERKELYDYCIDYDTILEKSKHSKEKCNKYRTYVKNIIELYKKFQVLCPADDKSNYSDFCKICENKDPKNLLDQLKCDSIGEKEKPPYEGASGIQSASNLGNAFLGVVVTSMTSGFLYKFTPLGTRIRNGLLWNNNNISNLNANGDELFVQESYSPYSGEEQHLIGYHPS
ncbi:unnamed protein product [Plasmodium vivax]|uniref:(malaria parasite P. vivax) hypothetical protein n=1 Tax=Plasmodium vivax TaxID=5855 RepID=A0A8S4HF15_PLAVI|nr:unnamed protein product [Plasmodium vivax]